MSQLFGDVAGDGDGFDLDGGLDNGVEGNCWCGCSGDERVLSKFVAVNVELSGPW